ncbi:MAG: 50S ribosomal protein L11 methyltransferase [Verrucomicrobiales bacterium]|nr:50S ribosomal protein L11 methyltransferase [Verrucomicrobiales bacterium]
METLFRWSKFVDENELEEWENRLLVEEIVYSAEKQVKRKRWQLSTYSAEREHAEELRSRFGGGVTQVYPGDWQPSAEAGAEPLLKIRNTLVVTEAEDESVRSSLTELFPDRTILSFPPQLAFGTGGHPTTAGCLRFLSDIAKERAGTEWSLLDLGCGSGILAVAAIKLGASRVVAVEIDEVALKYARKNAERHDCSDRIEFLAEDVIPLLPSGELGRFEVVAGNLFSSLLTQILPAVPGSLAHGGEGVFSGFLTSQTREVAEAAASAGIPLQDYLRRGKWVAARTARHSGSDSEND